MLRSLLSRRRGSAIAAVTVGAAFVAGPILAMATPAGAKAPPPPVVTAGSATPTTGPEAGGTAVTISGTNLVASSSKDGAPTVFFGYVPVTPVVASNGLTMTATSPAEAPGAVTVTVEYIKPGSKPKVETTTNAGTFTYTATVGAPAVTGVSPSSGAYVGGNTVTISGVNLGSATAIHFGSVLAGTPTSDTATSITVAAPAATASGAVAISVTTAEGTSATGASGDVYTYGPNTSAVGYLPPASLIIGSGSATTYSMMVGLADLFGAAPGCDLTNSKTNQLGLDCYNSATGYTENDAPESGTSTANDGEGGLPVSSINPLNDYVANAPATGSGNGRNEVVANNPLTAGPDGLTAFNVSFARSSSYKAVAGLNYVGYATDAVTWTSAIQTGGVATGHADVQNISTPDLKAVWGGTLSCNIGGVTYTMDWNCLEKDANVAIEPSADPIDCYTTQTASGTYSTWQAYLGFSAPPGCATEALEAGDNAGADPNALNDHINFTENQWGSIATVPNTSTQTNDTANAIYLFSYGKFLDTCTTDVTTVNDGFGSATTNTGVQSANCAGTPSGDVFNIGAINGIIPDEHTIQGNGDGTFTLGQQFPDNRYLYNAYANSAAANPANAATLNFVGSTGWLCRDTTTVIDPSTLVPYRTEIETTIKHNGFFPIDVSVGGVPQPFAQTDLNNIPSGEVGAGTFYPSDTLTSNLGFCYNSGATLGGS